MRLTFEFGPLNFDCTVTVGAGDEADASALNGGTLAGTVVAGPAEVPWEDAGSLHQFEAPEDKRRRTALGFTPDHLPPGATGPLH